MRLLSTLLSITFVCCLYSCTHSTTPKSKNYFIGEWKMGIKNVDGDYDNVLRIKEDRWILNQNRLHTNGWNYDDDTLVLKQFKETYTEKDDRTRLQYNDMKFIITDMGDNHFSAKPFFGPNIHTLEIRFDRL